MHSKIDRGAMRPWVRLPSPSEPVCSAPPFCPFKNAWVKPPSSKLTKLRLSMAACTGGSGVTQASQLSNQRRHPTPIATPCFRPATLRLRTSAPMLIPCKLESRAMLVVKEAVHHTGEYGLSSA
jgi:hypothetical protein